MGDPATKTSKAWSYKCQSEWGYLAEETALKPQSEAAKWHNELTKEYGGNYNLWPRIGRQQGFRAFKNGASIVMELKVGNESQTFVSERMPEALDDAIKKRNYDKFRTVCDELSPQELYDSLPMCFPMTHTLSVWGKTIQRSSALPASRMGGEGCADDDAEALGKVLHEGC